MSDVGRDRRRISKSISAGSASRGPSPTPGLADNAPGPGRGERCRGQQRRCLPGRVTDYIQSSGELIARKSYQSRGARRITLFHYALFVCVCACCVLCVFNAVNAWHLKKAPVLTARRAD